MIPTAAALLVVAEDGQQPARLSTRGNTLHLPEQTKTLAHRYSHDGDFRNPV